VLCGIEVQKSVYTQKILCSYARSAEEQGRNRKTSPFPGTPFNASFCSVTERVHTDFACRWDGAERMPSRVPPDLQVWTLPGASSGSGLRGQGRVRKSKASASAAGAEPEQRTSDAHRVRIG